MHLGRSGLPWTILRATQFHDLVRLLVAATARLPVMVVPSISGHLTPGHAEGRRTFEDYLAEKVA